jgi:hypothetical protein
MIFSNKLGVDSHQKIENETFSRFHFQRIFHPQQISRQTTLAPFA